MLYLPVEASKDFIFYTFSFRMSKLLKPKANDEYIDLIVGFDPEDPNSDEDLPSPPVRYYYS